MKCDKCGKPSVYHSTLIINGLSKTTNLCRECAHREGEIKRPDNVFDDMFNVFSDFLSYEKVADIECPVCKTTLKAFKSTNMLGCPHCYEIFNEEIKRILSATMKKTVHKEDKAEIIPNNQAKSKLEELRFDMKQAVKEERYEDAAAIKKQIQKLEAKDE